MKKLKVTLIDKTTLELLESGNKGDRIDIEDIDGKFLDTSAIENLMSKVRDVHFDKVLKNEIDRIEVNKKSEIKNLQDKLNLEKEKAIADLKNQLTLLKRNQEQQVKISQIELTNKFSSEKEFLKNEIQLKDKEINWLKDFRKKMSTKMVGETLEHHCELEFNRIGHIAFPNAKFEKDNDIVNGSKGDYIYKEYDEHNNEILSIMFEMKNEDQSTQNKHKNKDFYKKLDKDRIDKKCEFAVLVSMLEQENEFFDDIVSIQEYNDMYVIRPQHFITIISLLRKISLKSLNFKNEISILKHQSTDIDNFEQRLNEFKEGFGRNYKLASDRFTSAIEEIDKTIEHLSKVKNSLLSSTNNLRLANDKAEDLSIKKLSKNIPTIEKMFKK